MRAVVVHCQDDLPGRVERRRDVVFMKPPDLAVVVGVEDEPMRADELAGR